ncbi:DNA double-strand break repair and VJ recombination XRCC4 N-terminal [Penicillium malachiteum]|uniref:DNA double-strand break repair and VJ recombination XRCC4 N-terminal n=1 Tax=Penicillium malachiteum TaxID=1324776 RepID=UPI0025490CF5|nr:DNA double-strand break repair and VJ recombination XRCC4 N-terminal [Penicillium malachiteum]KAJ5735442.1 DNA double-strand break repair and VJ recombination XRCC4 N-terminal [Penicillium malachiteum]
MASNWHKLTLQQPNTPPLLSQFTWTREGYTLYVTDLTFIWSEELFHQEILKRAEEKATTIDPSEDHDQFNVLLEKIGETLRGEEGTTTINSGAEGDSLHLITKSKLPAPLRPLVWEIRLSKQASTCLTNHLLLPLLRDGAGWESRQQFLLDQIKQKDWILGRIFDKIGALGVDLGTVFPGAAGLRKTKKGSTRSEAARFIKGLAPFDESKWPLESGDSSESSGLAKKVLNELLGSEKDRDLEKLQATKEQWWTELPVFSETASFPSTKSDEPAAGDASPDQKHEKDISSQHDMDLDRDGASTASEDEFQRQETPPRLRAKSKRPEISPPAKIRQAAQQVQPALSTDPGEATASDSEPENTPAARRKRTPTPPQPRTKKTVEQTQRAPSPDLGESTASDSEPEIPAASQKHTSTPPKADKAPQPEPRESPKKAPKARGGLGVIGGKKKKEEKPPSPSPAPASSPPSQPAPSSSETAKPVADTNASPVKPKRATKLGMIGGKGKNKAAASKPESVSSPPATTQQDHVKNAVNTAQTELEKIPKEEEDLPKRQEKKDTPTLEETEAQKTARKREELKRQLAEKSKAPKKKRRF